MISVKLVNSEGEGFADNVEVADGTTAGGLFQLFVGMQGSATPDDYHIQKDGAHCTADTPLTNGCVVTIFPRGIKGAA